MKTNPGQIKIVPIAPKKIAQLREIAKQQLSPEEYEEFMDLTRQLAIHGMTQWINAQLGRLIAKLQWELEVEESPEWIQALIACDEKFLGRELKDMCYQYNLSDSGHKKILCRRLYEADVPEVVEVMEPYLGLPRVTEVKGKRLVVSDELMKGGVHRRMMWNLARKPK